MISTLAHRALTLAVLLGVGTVAEAQDRTRPLPHAPLPPFEGHEDAGPVSQLPAYRDGRRVQPTPGALSTVQNWEEVRKRRRDDAGIRPVIDLNGERIQ